MHWGPSASVQILPRYLLGASLEDLEPARWPIPGRFLFYKRKLTVVGAAEGCRGDCVHHVQLAAVARGGAFGVMVAVTLIIHIEQSRTPRL